MKILSQSIQFQIDSCILYVDSDWDLLVEDAQSERIFRTSIIHNPIELSLQKDSGSKVLHVEWKDELPLCSHITLSPPAGTISFLATNQIGGLGVGDIRDLRIGPRGYQWEDLSEVALTLVSNGIHLDIFSNFHGKDKDKVGNPFQQLDWPDTASLLEAAGFEV